MITLEEILISDFDHLFIVLFICLFVFYPGRWYLIWEHCHLWAGAQALELSYLGINPTLWLASCVTVAALLNFCMSHLICTVGDED